MESITSKLVEAEKLREKNQFKWRKNTEKMEQIERTK